MAAAAILKIEKSPYLGSSSSDFDEIWHGCSSIRLTVLTVGKLKFCKSEL